MASAQAAVFSALFLLVSSFSASAATIQNYSIYAEGSFTSLGYQQLYSHDRMTSAFSMHPNMSFAEATSADLDGHYLANALRAKTGSARLRYDAGPQSDGERATITDCTGFLIFLCEGRAQVFETETRTLHSYTVNSSITSLSDNGLLHRSDAAVGWSSESTIFFNAGALQTVAFNISSLDIDLETVPLPTSLALLLGGIAFLGGLRTKRALYS